MGLTELMFGDKENDERKRLIANLNSQLTYAQAVEGWLTERNNEGAFDTPEWQEFYERELAKIRERGRTADDEITKLRLGK